jgi:hypothetical protein
MANTIILTSTISDEHTQVTIEDDTVYTDPIRLGLEVVVRVFKVDFRGNESEITASADAEPDTAVAWVYDFSQDGHYRYKYYNDDVLVNTSNIVISVLTGDKRDNHAVDASLEVDMDAERNKDVDAFRLLDIFKEGMVAAASASEYSKAERIARRAEAL